MIGMKPRVAICRHLSAAVVARDEMKAVRQAHWQPRSIVRAVGTPAWMIHRLRIRFTSDQYTRRSGGRASSTSGSRHSSAMVSAKGLGNHRRVLRCHSEQDQRCDLPDFFGPVVIGGRRPMVAETAREGTTNAIVRKSGDDLRQRATNADTHRVSSLFACSAHPGPPYSHPQGASDSAVAHARPYRTR